MAVDTTLIRMYIHSFGDELKELHRHAFGSPEYQQAVTDCMDSIHLILQTLEEEL